MDKLTYAVLETTLQAYRQDQLHRIPAWRMILMTIPEIEERAQRLLQACASGQGGPLRMELVDGESVIGGGSAPGEAIPTRLVALRHAGLNAAVLENRLLACLPPVVARAESDAVLLDLRTVLPEQDRALAQAILSLAAG